jgi:endonuclease/exonuclease/phosphatase family metal-dependent hydrolase
MLTIDALHRPFYNFVDIPSKGAEEIHGASLTPVVSANKIVRVASYNITEECFDKKDQTSDHRHHAVNRAPYLKALLSKVNPDVLCLQEVSIGQACELQRHLSSTHNAYFLSQTPDIGDVAPAGEIALNGEIDKWQTKLREAQVTTPGVYPKHQLLGIFTRKSSYDITKIQAGKFWLKEHPDEVPTISGDSKLDKGFGNMESYRAVFWLKIQDSATGKPFYVFNSHYPFKGDNATRLKCAEFEISKIEELTQAESAPWISVGDRNLVSSTKDTDEINPSAVYRALTKDGAYKDIRDGHSTDNHFGASVTFTGFSYDGFQDKVTPKEFKRQSTLDVGIINQGFKSLMSFIHPGGYDPEMGGLVPISSYEDPAVRAKMEDGRYFASDHGLLGCDIAFGDV